MSKKSTIWFVVADGGHARIIQRNQDGFSQVSSMSSIDAQHESKDIGADKPGRTQDSVGNARHAIEPRSDPHELAKQAFAQEVAAAVNAGAQRNAFAQLLLVALPKTLHIIKAGLTGAAAARLIGEHAKDFVKLPDRDLNDRLAELAKACA